MSRTTWIGILVMAVFIVELFFYTWCRVQCTGMGYAISRTETHYQKLAAIKSNFTVELASLKSPDRIAKKAREELELVMPTPGQMVMMP
ncbi:MAG: cell division protein FtsL [Desulfobacterales bacterium]